MSALTMNDPAVAGRITQPFASIQTLNVQGPAGTPSSRIEFGAPRPPPVGGAAPAVPALWTAFSTSTTDGGLTKDHLQVMSYTNDGTYGVGTVAQQAMDIYPTPQVAGAAGSGAAITAINMACLDATRAGAITIGAGGAAAIACPSTTASSRCILGYLGGAGANAIAVPAAGNAQRVPGTGFNITGGTQDAVYSYLIIG